MKNLALPESSLTIESQEHYVSALQFELQQQRDRGEVNKEDLLDFVHLHEQYMMARYSGAMGEVYKTEEERTQELKSIQKIEESFKTNEINQDTEWALMGAILASRNIGGTDVFSKSPAEYLEMLRQK